MNTQLQTARRFGALMVVSFLAVVACGKQPPPKTPQAASLPSASEQFAARLTQLGAERGERGWTVPMASTKFKSGQTSFEPADATRIDHIADILKARPDIHITVQAFTDSRGGASHNRALSQQRADAVLQALKERGVNVAQVRAEGLGETQPIASNDTEEGRAQNRRIQIVFSDIEGEFASAAALDQGD